MNAGQQRIIHFAGSTVAVEHSGAQAADIVDFLYRHIPSASSAAPDVVYRLDSAERLTLRRGEALIYAGDQPGDCAELLQGEVCHHLADQSKGGLLFHAACLARRGQGLLLPGGIGAGKTTLAAWLAAKGFDYLTDELVFAPRGADTLQTFTRPLNIKGPAQAVLRDCFDWDSPNILRAQDACLLSPAAWPSAQPGGEPALRLIIFPHYTPGSPLQVQALSKARAGLELMQCLVNARNLPDYGLAEIARLAQIAPAYTMRYADLVPVAERIAALLPD